MRSPCFEIVTVKSGAKSVRSLANGETFHPVVGPQEEALALHVRQQRLAERAAANEGGAFVIWDVGLGAAGNALAVLEAFADFRGAAQVEMHSFDETTGPLAFALEHADALGFAAAHRTAICELLANGRAAPANVRWILHTGDFREIIHTASLPAPHAILYDPYSAQSNPGMWSLDHLFNLHACLRADAPCLLTNYTRSTAIRVTLLLAGFFVGRGAGIGEKEETTIASNQLPWLEAPLRADWLARVRSSTNAAPLGPAFVPGAIDAASLRALEQHPQFAPAP